MKIQPDQDSRFMLPEGVTVLEDRDVNLNAVSLPVEFIRSQLQIKN